MYNNSEYLIQKEANAAKARFHLEEIKKFDAEIQHSIEHTSEYTETVLDNHTEAGHVPTCTLINHDCVSAIMQTVQEAPFARTAVLNFANYKTPGGTFLQGSTSQEECLCYASTLYPVLTAQSQFYNRNCTRINKGLYTNRALYSEAIRFEQDGNVVLCDVLTCAAPNRKIAQDFCHVSDNENLEALTNRIKFLLDVADYNHVDNLILGAFGCGAFHQSARQVARIFQEHLNSGRYHFKNIIFAVPTLPGIPYSHYDMFKLYF